MSLSYLKRYDQIIIFTTVVINHQSYRIWSR